jgi:hypothetical protein
VYLYVCIEKERERVRGRKTVKKIENKINMVTARQSGFAVYAMKTRSETMGRQQTAILSPGRLYTHVYICVRFIHVVAEDTYTLCIYYNAYMCPVCVCVCVCVDCVRNVYMCYGPIEAFWDEKYEFYIRLYARAKFIVRNFVNVQSKILPFLRAVYTLSTFVVWQPLRVITVSYITFTPVRDTFVIHYCVVHNLYIRRRWADVIPRWSVFGVEEKHCVRSCVRVCYIQHVHARVVNAKSEEFSLLRSSVKLTEFNPTVCFNDGQTVKIELDYKEFNRFIVIIVDHVQHRLFFKQHHYIVVIQIFDLNNRHVFWMRCALMSYTGKHLRVKFTVCTCS